MSEQDIQRAILDALQWLPEVFVWRQNTGALKNGGRFLRFGRPGQADITGILIGGRRLDIEVKSATGKLSANQRAYQDEVRAMGGIYIVARSVEDAIEGIERAKRGEI